MEEVACIPDGAANAEDVLLERDRMVALGASLAQVPEPFRKTLLMSLEGNSLEEIAAAVMVSTGTVKSRLSRGRERLRLLMRDIFGG